jgi:hypothetical protein
MPQLPVPPLQKQPRTSTPEDRATGFSITHHKSPMAIHPFALFATAVFILHPSNFRCFLLPASCFPLSPYFPLPTSYFLPFSACQFGTQLATKSTGSGGCW